MSERIWSQQQQAVYAAVESPRGGNLQVVAVAGSGKTTTLVEACRRMTGTVAFCAYNKKIADEIKVRVQDLKNVTAGTFHSFGFKALMKVLPGRAQVLDKKLFALQDELRQPDWVREFARGLVSIAKQSAFGVLTPMDDQSAWYRLVEHFELADKLPESEEAALDTAIPFAQALLKASNEQAQTKSIIDFDDMIYLPLLLNAKMWQHDWVLIDEAQDTNPCRRALAKKLLRPGGRLVSVGDPCQAIYGFTGADNDALDIIAREFSCTTMPLTVTYRCPKSVVAHARQLVSHIEAHESSPMGSVTEMLQDEFDTLPAEQLRSQDAVLCRNTKPLVSLAYSLIRRGIGCHVEGRDIGAGLMALARRWKVRTCAQLGDKLEAYLERETSKLMAKGQEMKAESLADRVDTLHVIMSTLAGSATISELTAAINRLFGDTEPGQPSPNLTLSTVHKSKGREWDRVYLLGRNAYMPSKYARQEWQQEQERNLQYVAITRAKAELVEVRVAIQNGRKAKEGK